MAPHKQFLPQQSQTYGYHWQLPENQRQAITRYSTSRRHNQLVKCTPTAFRRAAYTTVPGSVVIKIKQNRLIWSTDFGHGSHWNESGRIANSYCPHTHVLKAAVKALEKVRSWNSMSIKTVVLVTEDVDLVRRAAWGEDLDRKIYGTYARELYVHLMAEMRYLQTRGCEVLFWLQ